jgi:hypothetical protein
MDEAGNATLVMSLHVVLCETQTPHAKTSVAAKEHPATRCSIHTKFVVWRNDAHILSRTHMHLHLEEWAEKVECIFWLLAFFMLSDNGLVSFQFFLSFCVESLVLFIRFLCSRKLPKSRLAEMPSAQTNDMPSCFLQCSRTSPPKVTRETQWWSFYHLCFLDGTALCHNLP